MQPPAQQIASQASTTWIENIDYFLIRIRRQLPERRAVPVRPPIQINMLDVASSTPCWHCGGKNSFNRSVDEREGKFIFRCSGCHRFWLIERGGNPETLVIRVSEYIEPPIMPR